MTSDFAASNRRSLFENNTGFDEGIEEAIMEILKRRRVSGLSVRQIWWRLPDRWKDFGSAIKLAWIIRRMSEEGLLLKSPCSDGKYPRYVLNDQTSRKGGK